MMGEWVCAGACWPCRQSVDCCMCSDSAGYPPSDARSRRSRSTTLTTTLLLSCSVCPVAYACCCAETSPQGALKQQQKAQEGKEQKEQEEQIIVEARQAQPQQEPQPGPQRQAAGAQPVTVVDFQTAAARYVGVCLNSSAAADAIVCASMLLKWHVCCAKHCDDFC